VAFDLTPIPANAVVNSVTLQMNINEENVHVHDRRGQVGRRLPNLQRPSVPLAKGRRAER
jgi:hypothetical protein